jgi:hypothetical protein
MKIVRLISDYRWPIYIAGHLTMSVVACGVLVWVATRPDTPRPIPDYYQSARNWDADEGAIEASRELGWQVRFSLPGEVPYVPGAPRPVDVVVIDRSGRPVSGLAGRLLAIRPSDARLNQDGALVEMPARAGNYRTLMRLDTPGAWEFRLDARLQALHFVQASRLTLDDASNAAGAAP